MIIDTMFSDRASCAAELRLLTHIPLGLLLLHTNQRLALKSTAMELSFVGALLASGGHTMNALKCVRRRSSRTRSVLEREKQSSHVKVLGFVERFKNTLSWNFS